MPSPSRNRILIVDDHPMMREGLRTLISRERDLIVCGEAETAGQALDAVANLKPDLVLADITLPGPQRHRAHQRHLRAAAGYVDSRYLDARRIALR